MRSTRACSMRDVSCAPRSSQMATCTPKKWDPNERRLRSEPSAQKSFGGRTERSEGRPMSRPIDLEAFLTTDPKDIGCGEAMEVLHAYADMVAADEAAQERFPEVAAHLQACGPCTEDLDALVEAVRTLTQH